MPFARISIIGVGLLGGSLGLAVRSRLNNCSIVGYGHRESTLNRAKEMGAIEQAAGSIEQAVADADLVVLCTPVGLFREVLEQAAGSLKPGCIVTDVGSTKRSVVRLGEGILGRKAAFVGSHPMAGSEKRGIEYARTDLFENALCITTPTPNTNPEALDSVEEFWRVIGMRIRRVAPEEHDALLADVSHLPHAVAAALVAMQEESGLELAGKGFLDATRIAGGDGGLWRDILLDNRDNFAQSLSRLEASLARLRALVETGDGPALAQWLDAMAARREKLVQMKLRELNPD